MTKPEERAHNELIQALAELLQEARNYEFHDFKNTKYPMPKTALVDYLELLLGRVKEGVYDD